MKTMKTMLAGILMLCLAVSCKHDEVLEDTAAGLPKETMIGANTFGCKINGKPWIPINDMEFGPGSEDFAVSMSSARKTAWVVARNIHGTNRETLLIRMEDILFKPQFRVSINDKYKNGEHKSSCTLWDNKISTAPSIEYHTSPTRTGWVEITRLDTVARIIAGRFEFSMQVEGGDSVLNVTDGRFDIKF